MQSVIQYLKLWQPHPFVDHFTVALILLGIITDLIASIFASRVWIRYMALSLMIAGAIGAAGSNLTGGWEAGRVWDSVSGPGKDVLERHAWWGDILPWVFGALALWRLASQFIGFIAVTRPIYLLAAIVGGVLIVYQGHLGSVMVYDYGIGTALLGGSQTAPPSPLPSPVPPSPEATSTAAIPASPLPSSPSPIPSAAPTSIPSVTGSILPSPSPTASIPPAASTTPSSAQPSPTGGAPLNPPPTISPSPTGAAKNL